MKLTAPQFGVMRWSPTAKVSDSNKQQVETLFKTIAKELSLNLTNNPSADLVLRHAENLTGNTPKFMFSMRLSKMENLGKQKIEEVKKKLKGKEIAGGIPFTLKQKDLLKTYIKSVISPWLERLNKIVNGN